MGFIRRTLEYAVGRSLSEVINKTVRQVVEPKATQYANSTARHINNAGANAEYADADNLTGAVGNLENSITGYANHLAANLKICPNCEKPSSADKKFCPHCGTKLPEATIAENAKCLSCGKQNSIGTKFCTGCGAKLSGAIREEALPDETFTVDTVSEEPSFGESVSE